MPSKTPVLTGSLNSSGHPVLQIKIYGLDPAFAQEFEAMIDTGFTGFLMMPLLSAFPLGLVLSGTSNYTLADGSTSAKLNASGNVMLADGDSVSGIIVLETNQTGLLLGMDFLRRAKRCLTVSSSSVVLLHEDSIPFVLEALGKGLDSTLTDLNVKADSSVP